MGEHVVRVRAEQQVRIDHVVVDVAVIVGRQAGDQGHGALAAQGHGLDAVPQLHRAAVEAVADFHGPGAAADEVAEARELRVRPGAVVALAVVLADELPVGLHLVGPPPAAAQLGQPEAAEIRQVLQLQAERRGGGVQVQEDEALVGAERATGTQRRGSSRPEARRLARRAAPACRRAGRSRHGRGRGCALRPAPDGSSISRDPRCRQTLKNARTRPSAPRRPGSESPPIVPVKIVPGGGDVCLPTDAEPGAAEQARLFQRRDRRRRVDAAGSVRASANGRRVAARPPAVHPRVRPSSVRVPSR